MFRVRINQRYKNETLWSLGRRICLTHNSNSMRGRRPISLTIIWFNKFGIWNSNKYRKWKDSVSLAAYDWIRNHVWISFEVLCDRSVSFTNQVHRFKPCTELNSKYFRRIFNYKESHHSHVSTMHVISAQCALMRCCLSPRKGKGINNQNWWMSSERGSKR